MQWNYVLLTPLALEGTARLTLTFRSKWLYSYVYSFVLSLFHTFVQSPIYLSNHHLSNHLPWPSHPFSWSIYLPVSHSFILYLPVDPSKHLYPVSSEYMTYIIWPLICGINQGIPKQRMSRNYEISKGKEDIFLTFKVWVGERDLCTEICTARQTEQAHLDRYHDVRRRTCLLLAGRSQGGGTVWAGSPWRLTFLRVSSTGIRITWAYD